MFCSLRGAPVDALAEARCSAPGAIIELACELRSRAGILSSSVGVA
jgi:hypothetical protein